MSSGYRLIFIGFILILIDLRINTFDLLPDFIGYAFVINGLSGLTIKGSAFEKAKLFAILLLFLSLPSVIGIGEINLDDKYITFFSSSYELILGLTHLLMMYFIFMGTWEMALKFEDENWVHHAKSRWNIYATVNIFFLCLYAFSFNYPTLKPLIIIFIVIVLIVEVIAIIFVKKTQSRSNTWVVNNS